MKEKQCERGGEVGVAFVQEEFDGVRGDLHYERESL